MFGILGLPIPDETVLVLCGFLISKGEMDWRGAFGAGFAGSVCGISLSYVLGRRYGYAVAIRYGRYVGLTSERLTLTHRWFDRFGAWLLPAGYFIPGVRHFTALVAGMSQLEYRTFALFAYSGAAVWVATFLLIGSVVGEKWRETSEMMHRYFLFGTVCVAVLAIAGWCLRKRVTRR